MKYSIFILSILLFTTKMLFAQWIPSNGINGGYCTDIVKTDSALFVTCDGVGILRQFDDTIWKVVYNQNSYGLINLNNVLITQPNMYFPNSLLRSFDGGNTWESIVYDSLNLGSLVKANNELFAWDLMHYFIIKSVDYGASWQQVINTGEESFCNVYSDDNQIYFNDINNPLTWNNFNPINSSIDTIIFPKDIWPEDIQNLDSCILVVYDSVFSYNFTSQKWSVSTNENHIYNLVVFDSVLYGTGTKGIYKYTYTNGWIECNIGLSNHDVNEFVAGNNDFHCTTSTGVFKADSSLSWQSNNNGINSANIYSIASLNDDILVGTLSGLYKSSNGGTSYIKINDTAISKVILTDSVYYVSDFRNLLISRDKGENWEEIPFDFLSQNGGVDNFGLGDKYIFALSGDNSGNKLFRTGYNPISWEAIDGTDDPYLSSFAVHDSTVFLGKLSSSMLDFPISVSYNNGENFQILPEFHDLYYHNIKFENNKFYVYYNNNIALSTDNGESWDYVTVDDTYLNISDFEQDSNYFIVAGWYYDYSPKVYQSFDSGNSWTDISGNLINPLDHVLTKVNINDNRVFVGTPSQGLWYRDDLFTEISKQELKSTMGLKIIPNPNNGNFTVEVNSTKACSGILTITDSKGELIRKENVNLYQGLNQIPVSIELSEGIYNVNFQSDIKQMHSAKFVKIR